MEAFDAVTRDHDHEQGGDIKEQIAAYRETLTDSEQADYLVGFTLEPKRTLKCVISDSKRSVMVSIATKEQKSWKRRLLKEVRSPILN